MLYTHAAQMQTERWMGIFAKKTHETNLGDWFPMVMQQLYLYSIVIQPDLPSHQCSRQSYETSSNNRVFSNAIDGHDPEKTYAQKQYFIPKKALESVVVLLLLQRLRFYVYSCMCEMCVRALDARVHVCVLRRSVPSRTLFNRHGRR